ncbi:hypothetical protein [Halobellus litoreus]|uniref:Uncharacterized protein n=1 Tax=Halobellus litoreus TaxID=755310 RepID=A0ABD6DSM5_9EURY|nr:hypothetical protein [Halobellus litoreus]
MSVAPGRVAVVRHVDAGEDGSDAIDVVAIGRVVVGVAAVASGCRLLAIGRERMRSRRTRRTEVPSPADDGSSRPAGFILRRRDRRTCDSSR